MKLAFVTPWYGEDARGGAETELRNLLRHLNQFTNPSNTSAHRTQSNSKHDAGHGSKHNTELKAQSNNKLDIEVLTTCVRGLAYDWYENYHMPGETTDDGIKVRRFWARIGNSDIYRAINERLLSGDKISQREELIFIEESINSPDLYDYIAKNKAVYDLFIFIPYLYGTTYFGAGICPEKSVLIPCFHDEAYFHLSIFKECCGKIKGMIFHSEPEQMLTQQHYDISNVSHAVLGEGIDTDINSDAQRFRKKYKISSPFILCVGRKHPSKNTDLLLGYFNRYKNPDKDSPFHIPKTDADIATRDLPEPSVKSTARNKLKLVLIGPENLPVPDGIKNDVIDLGFVPQQDKYDAYAAASILCNLSVNESFSIVIMESWLAGRPVIVSDACAVTSHFARVSAGGFAAGSFDDFAAGLDFLLLNPGEAGKMGERGKEYVQSNFARDIVTKKYVDFFKSLCL